MNYNNVQIFTKEAYKVLIPFFVIGFLFGLAVFAFFASDCKDRKELCSLDIKEIASLRNVLKEQELKCIEAIDTATSEITKHEEEKCSSSLKRIKAACNDLDCAQCRR